MENHAVLGYVIQVWPSDKGYTHKPPYRGIAWINEVREPREAFRQEMIELFRHDMRGFVSKVYALPWWQGQKMNQILL